MVVRDVVRCHAEVGRVVVEEHAEVPDSAAASAAADDSGVQRD